jgi:predicted RNA-binding protein with RPS1 domain
MRNNRYKGNKRNKRNRKPSFEKMLSNFLKESGQKDKHLNKRNKQKLEGDKSGRRKNKPVEKEDGE